MARNHDGFKHTSRQLTTCLRTDTTPVVPVRATESCKCQTSICLLSRNPLLPFRLWSASKIYPCMKYLFNKLVCISVCMPLSGDQNYFCLNCNAATGDISKHIITDCRHFFNVRESLKNLSSFQIFSA